jgi:hypothetical protein
MLGLTTDSPQEPFPLPESPANLPRLEAAALYPRLIPPCGEGHPRSTFFPSQFYPRYARSVRYQDT